MIKAKAVATTMFYSDGRQHDMRKLDGAVNLCVDCKSGASVEIKFSQNNSPLRDDVSVALTISDVETMQWLGEVLIAAANTANKLKWSIDTKNKV